MIRDVSYRIAFLRKGVQAGELCWDAGSAPTIDFNSTATIKSSLSGVFLPNADLNPLSDELRPIMTVNGSDYSLGVYPIATYSEQNTDLGRTISLEAYDRSWRVQSAKTERILHLAAGTNYLEAVQQLLTEAGIILVLATPTSAVLQTDREDWPIGTDFLTICNTLLAEINYNSLWFDAEGFARLEPSARPSADRIAHRYSVEDMKGTQPMTDNSSAGTDLFDKPNVFIVICSNPDLDAPMIARSENDSPISKVSTFCRGLRIPSVIQVDNIGSQEELQAYADKLRLESLFGTVNVIFYTLAEGGHGMKDTLSINKPGMDGIYQETAWHLTMRPGELMTHEARKVVFA